jgi:osmotically-inducible protein OsmY
VLADGGIVRLRGAVGSFRQRGAAIEDANSIHGMDGVFDDVNVRLQNHDGRVDDEISLLRSRR